MSKIHRHPLERTYEELQRCLNRVESYMGSGHMDIKDEEKILEVRKGIVLAFDSIPERFQNTYFVKKKDLKGSFWKKGTS